MRATIMWTVTLRRRYTGIMSRAFVDEDAGGQDAARYTLPDRADPGYDLAAARALLRGADQGDTVGAEAATGYYWGDPALFSHVERLLLEAREDRNDRLEQLAERFLRGPVRPRPGAELDAALNPHRAEEQARARERNLDVLASVVSGCSAVRPTTSSPISGPRSTGSSRSWKRAAATR